VTSTNRGTFGFAVRGSLTGEDGSGQSTANFRSDSGRVVIRAGDWSLPEASPGFVAGWDTLGTGVDALSVSAPTDPTSESAVTVVQGLADGPHVLSLESSPEGIPAIAAVRFYCPAERARVSVEFPRFTWNRLPTGPRLQWPACVPGWRPERSASAGTSGWSLSTTPLGASGQILWINPSARDAAGFYRLRFDSLGYGD
jgi:hypothetical protein